MTQIRFTWTGSRSLKQKDSITNFVEQLAANTLEQISAVKEPLPFYMLSSYEKLISLFLE